MNLKKKTESKARCDKLKFKMPQKFNRKILTHAATTAPLQQSGRYDTTGNATPSLHVQILGSTVVLPM